MTLAAAFSIAALTLVAPAHGQAQTPPRPAVSAPHQAVEIPMVLAGTQILVEGVKVNGRGPYRFLLDTGAQGAGRADVSLVQALNLPQVGVTGASDGSGGARRELTVNRIDRLEFGGLVFENLEVVSRDYNGDAEAVRGGISGILGIDLFHGYLLTLDYGRGVLRLEPGALPPADGRGVLALDPDRPVPSVMMTLGGRQVLASIDTGSMGDIGIGQETADALTFVTPPVGAGQARTVSGEFEILQGRIDGDLELGAIRIPRPEVTVIPHFRVANLGGEFLKNFVTTLDMANRRVRFAPATAAVATAPATQPRRYGLMMPPPAGGESELVVDRVAPGSPAEAGGVRAGDRIVTLNGVAVPELGSRLAQFMRATPLVVGLIRDGERREITLRLD